MRHISKLLLTSAISVSIALAVMADEQTTWLGEKVMVTNASAKLTENGQELHTLVELGNIFLVTKVDGQWLWVGRGWIHQLDVISFDQAVDYFSAKIACDPSGSNFSNRAYAFNLIGDYDNAIGDYNEAIQRDAGNDRELAAHYNDRGLVWELKRQYASALADFNEAVRHDAQNSVTYMNAGRVRGEMGDFERAVADFEVALLFNSADGSIYRQRGYVRHEMNEFDTAIADYDQAIRLDPRDAIAYHFRGEAWAAKGDSGRALADFNESIRLDPGDSYAITGRGEYWRLHGEFDKALVDFNEAVRLDATNNMAFNDRGLVWIAKEENDKAIADFNAAIQIDPNVGCHFVNRGDSWQAKGDWELAIADYNAALHLDPNNSCVLDSLAWLWSTCPDERFRDGTRAVQFATRACELDRWQNGNDLAVLAAAYTEAGDFNLAVDWLGKAFEVVPDDASFQARNLPKLELFKACKPFRQEVKTNQAVRVPTETSLITP